MVSAVDRAKRALVSRLKALGRKYDVRLDVDRNAADQDVRSAFRKMSRKSHPDRGGDVQDQSSLNAAYEAWMDAVKAASRGVGRPKKSGASGDLVSDECQKPGFRFRSVGVLLSYQKFGDSAFWTRFLSF